LKTKLKEDTMNNRKHGFFIGFFVLLVAGTMSSCNMVKGLIPAAPSAEAAPPVASGKGESADVSTVETGTFKSGYSWFTQIPSKEYNAVGIVVARDGDTPVASLMEAARALGADEVINIRLDTETVSGKEKVLAASGVAVKYQAAYYTGDAEVGSKLVNSGGVHWSKYSMAPSRDFTAVKIVTIKGDNITTPAADLMEAAKALGAHDIINVRVDTATALTKGRKIVGASALAITYTSTPYRGTNSATAN
jgi:uncharacterized protein YbjQ (UPF0145 family)